MSFENPKKGGLAVVSKKECMIRSCFGDDVLCARSQNQDLDDYFVNQNLEITKRLINKKQYMVHFDGPKEIKIKLSPKMQLESVLTDKEVKLITKKCFEISNEDSIFEFLITQNNELNLYGVHPYKS